MGEVNIETILVLLCLVAATLIIFFWLYRLWIQGSRYTKNTRIDGKVVLITGANTGIGKETAIALAQRGGKIYIACRSTERGNAARNDIIHRSKSSNVHYRQLDLASMKSIRKFVTEFVAEESQLHILINNAGVFACPQSQTEDGFEMQFGVNHLGHFLLTNLLLDKLTPARIINVTSMLHLKGEINKDDLMFEKHDYDPFIAYNQSKLANVIFTKELSRRYPQISSFTLHPGLINTEAFRHLNDKMAILKPFSRLIAFLLFKTPEAGAQTTLYCALKPGLPSGGYFNNCKLAKANPLADDERLSKFLWDESAKLVKLTSMEV